MQVLNQENHQAGILPKVTNSQVTGVHTSIFVPVESEYDLTTARFIFSRLSQEARRLLEPSMTDHELNDHLRPITRAFESLKFSPGTKGVAFFKSSSAFYHTTLRVAPPELVVVADSFHVKPLLHCISSRPACYAFALTSRQIKVFRVEGDHVTSVKSYANKLEENDNKKKGGFIGQRKRNKEVTDKFIRDVAKKLHKDFNLRHRGIAILGPRALRRKLEVELAAKTPLNVFHQSTLYASLEEMGVAVEEAMSAQTKTKSQKFVKRLINTSDKGMITSSLDEIASAAVQGRIERLVIDPFIQVWGLYNRTNGLVRTYNKQISHEDDCVMDDISEEVIKNGGDVVFFDSSQLENVAPYMAVLRW